MSGVALQPRPPEAATAILRVLMALRGFVTGSDACTPSDGGAGPSNAVAGLANTLLGRSTKAQEQLREV